MKKKVVTKNLEWMLFKKDDIIIYVKEFDCWINTSDALTTLPNECILENPEWFEDAEYILHLSCSKKGLCSNVPLSIIQVQTIENVLNSKAFLKKDMISFATYFSSSINLSGCTVNKFLENWINLNK